MESESPAHRDRDRREASWTDLGAECVPRRLVSLQCLRGVAAIMVVFHHVLHQSPGFLALWTTEAWQAGVDLFFVISGFVMVYVTSTRDNSPRRFLAMRAVRIVPVYWFYTLGAAVLIILMPRLFRSNQFSARHLVTSMFFVPDGAPLVKQGWTLNYEVFFYLLFAIAMAVSMRRRVLWSACALIAFTILGVSADVVGFSLGPIGFYGNNIILEFAFGMLIARAFLRGKMDRIGTSAAVLLVAGGFIMIFIMDSCAEGKRGLVYGLPAAAVVIGALAFENQTRALRFPALQFLGDASYSIYLVHIFPIAVLRAIWPHTGLSMEGLRNFGMFLLASLFLVIALGALSYYAIERVSLRYLRAAINSRLQ